MQPRRNNTFGSIDTMAQMAGPIRHNYPETAVPELDPKDERLLYLAEQNGFLAGRNSILEVGLRSAEQSNKNLELDLRDVRAQLKDAQENRDQYRDNYWKYKSEAERLAQYEPKEEKKPNEGSDLSSRNT